MEIQINGEIHKAEAYSVEYLDNDMMNGICLETSGQFFFLSDHIESHREVQEHVELQYYTTLDGEIDWDYPPHNMIAHSIGQLIIKTAEGLLDE